MTAKTLVWDRGQLLIPAPLLLGELWTEGPLISAAEGALLVTALRGPAGIVFLGCDRVPFAHARVLSLRILDSPAVVNAGRQVNAGALLLWSSCRLSNDDLAAVCPVALAARQERFPVLDVVEVVPGEPARSHASWRSGQNPAELVGWKFPRFSRDPECKRGSRPPP